MNIIINNLLVNYSREGSGKAILMLHGWGDDLSTFDALATKLVNDFEIVRLDLPGFGKSQPPAEAWGLEDYARFVNRFLEKIEATPYGVVGHSNGGAISIKSVSSGIITPEKLVLLASSGVRTGRAARNTLWSIVAKTGKAGTLLLPAKTKASLRKKLYRSAGSDILIAPVLEQTFKKIVKENILEQSQKITIPTLLIYGEKDQDTPLAYGEAFHQSIQGSMYHTLDSAGHFVHHDKSEIVNNMIDTFLR